MQNERVFRLQRSKNFWFSGTSIAQLLLVKTPVRIALCALWLLAAGAGTWALMTYETTPTPVGSTPSQWPADSHISRQAGRSTLVMFVHPHCPCSRSSMEELDRLLVQCKDSMTTHVLFIRPKGVPEDWTNTSLRKSAESIPGVHVALDQDGKEAERFGAESSGYVVLYSPKGELLFSGGITASRGHAGENPAEDAVIALATGHQSSLHHSDVFGCGLKEHCDIATTNENNL